MLRLKKQEEGSHVKVSAGSKVFDVINVTLLTLLALTTFYPFWDCLVVSFSSLKSYLATSIHPVSYTHLDVYKRQVIKYHERTTR